MQKINRFCTGLRKAGCGLGTERYAETQAKGDFFLKKDVDQLNVLTYIYLAAVADNFRN